MLQFLHGIFKRRSDEVKYRRSKLLICKGITKKPRVVEIFSRKSVSKKKNSIEELLGSNCIVLLNINKSCPNCGHVQHKAVNNEIDFKENKREAVEGGENQGGCVVTEFNAANESVEDNKAALVSKSVSTAISKDLVVNKPGIKISGTIHAMNISKPKEHHDGPNTIKNQYISGLKLKDKELNDIEVAIDEIKKFKEEQKLIGEHYLKKDSKNSKNLEGESKRIYKTKLVTLNEKKSSTSGNAIVINERKLSKNGIAYTIKHTNNVSSSVKRVSLEYLPALSFKAASSESVLKTDKFYRHPRTSLSCDEILKKISESKLDSKDRCIPLIHSFASRTRLEFDSKFRLHSKIYLTSSEKDLYDLDFI